jgi:hypothetical protein
MAETRAADDERFGALDQRLTKIDGDRNRRFAGIEGKISPRAG